MIGINALELGLAVLIVPDASFNQQTVTTTLSAPRAAPNVNLLDRTRTCNAFIHTCTLDTASSMNWAAE